MRAAIPLLRASNLEKSGSTITRLKTLYEGLNSGHRDGILTISPVDITTTSGQNTLSTNLVTNTPVKVFGIPQADGSIKCYVLSYFTGFAQATTN